MRVGTFTMYSDFTRNQQNSISLLNDVNRTIYSGTKIEYAYQGTSIFANSLRLDQEEYSLAQNSQSADMARQFALNSDNSMNQMVTALTSFKTKLIKATSESNSTTDRRAIAQELIGLKQHLMDLANTSINGQYLFSGSAFTKKPIDVSGNYQGNSSSVKALIGSGVELPFNIDGNSLFLGSDSDYKRVVSTNVPKKNITLLYDQPPVDRYITVDDKIKDMTGNNGDGSRSYFYISGTQSDGTSFNQRIDMDVDAPISDLLDKIKTAYKDTVEVTLNNHGQIEIKDLRKGSSKLQFQMVATDNSTALTKATAGVTAGSTSITIPASASVIPAGSLLNIEGIGQVQVTANVNIGDTAINFQPPLSTSVTPGSAAVNVKLVSAITTTIPGGAALGATNLTLGSTAGMNAGDEIIIGGRSYTIASVTNATDLVLSSGLVAAAAAGAPASMSNPLANLSALGDTGQTISEFTKSGMGQLNTANATAWNDSWDHSTFNFNIEFKNRNTGAISQVQDLLNTATGGFPTSITLNGNAHVFAPALGATSTIGDFVDQVQTALDAEFGANQFAASLVNGKIVVKDKDITPNQPNLQSSQLVSMTINAPANTFAAVNGLSSDEVYFKKEGATLSSTVSQVVKSTNEYAKPTDTLLSVAGANTMVGRSITMNLTTINGAAQTVTVNFAAAASTFTVGGNTYNILNAASPQVTTPGDQVTYQQFMDVISMVIGDTLPATVTPAAPTPAQAADYNNAVMASNTRSEVYLNDNGQLTIKDLAHSATVANISIFDTAINTNYTTTRQTSTTTVSVNSNNAITVDDPYISFFDQLQMAIDSVLSGKTRASDDGDDPRNTGMQNAITAIDHVFDHLVRKHTDIGAVGNAFQLSQDRSTALKINVITVRSSILDTDVGSAYLELNQRSINYQALLATANKVNSLTLVNYMK